MSDSIWAYGFGNWDSWIEVFEREYYAAVEEDESYMDADEGWEDWEPCHGR